MNKFLATLDRLSSGFADDVVAAVRKTPGDELYRLLGKTPPAPASAPVVVKRTAVPALRKAPVAKKEVTPKKKTVAAPVTRKEAAPKKEVATRTPVAKKEAAPKAAAPVKATGPLGAAAIVSVRRFFEECGRRGATAQQVQRHLEHDETDPRIPALLRELTHEGVIRDAGFRRTTGNGTQPVLVIV